MIIIHDVNTMPRLATAALLRASRAMPVIVVSGARQTGKSTLVRELVPGADRRYLTLDAYTLAIVGPKAPAKKSLPARKSARGSR